MAMKIGLTEARIQVKHFLQPLFSKFSSRFLNPQISFAHLNSNCSNVLDLETKYHFYHGVKPFQNSYSCFHAAAIKNTTSERI